MATSDADNLARQALCTPAINDAPPALEVLVDVLLEAGMFPNANEDEDALGLRERAYRWAKQRHAPLPSPTHQLATMVLEALRGVGGDALPHAVVGAVGPFVIRVHFLGTIDPQIADEARAAIALRVVGPIIEVTMLG